MIRFARDILYGLTLSLAAVLVLLGVVVTIGSATVRCDLESTTYLPGGEEVTERSGCGRDLELVPYGLAVAAGGALTAYGAVLASRRRNLALVAVVVGPLPAAPLAGVTALGVVPYLAVPIGIVAVLLRSFLPPAATPASP
jgi:hypothetical protein